jgi:rare lipoprotein A
MKLNTLYWLLPLLALVSACSQTPAPPGIKIGKPYSISGKTYYPEYDPTYDKIGMASWYGPGFHSKKTASGERFDQNDLTAAHPTLPMPSIVRVTNLKNGRSLIVRINDRGPFAANRIIDLSKRSAEKIGITGVSEVRVQFLQDETETYIASITGQSGRKSESLLALNDSAKKERDASIIRSTEPSDQLVEASNANTAVGDTVNRAAPITSVTSGDLIQASDIKPAAGKSSETVARPVEFFHATPASGKSLYYIQAGSFSSEENARKLQSKLNDIGNVDISQVDANERTWWRVRVGPFNASHEAKEALEKVHAANIQDARIIHQ